MYCQACGAKNTEDARFCNMCGSSIAAVGSPGGPIAAPTQVGLGVPQGPDPKGVNIPLAHAATVHGPLVVAPGGAAPGGPSGGGAPSATATTPAKYALGPHTGELECPSGYLPSAMNNTMSVSLEAIGVRSSRRTWAVIALASIGLVALGALGMRCSSGEAPVAHGGAEPDDLDMLIRNICDAVKMIKEAEESLRKPLADRDVNAAGPPSTRSPQTC